MKRVIMLGVSVLFGVSLLVHGPALKAAQPEQEDYEEEEAVGDEEMSEEDYIELDEGVWSEMEEEDGGGEEKGQGEGE